MIKKVRTSVGGGVTCIAYISYIILGLAGVAVNLSIVMAATGWGFFGVVLGIFFFPVTLVAVPWYALLGLGNPFPLILTYGGFILISVLAWVGHLIGGQD